MDFSQTAVIRIQTKQLDKLFSMSNFDCAVTFVAALVLIGAALLFKLPILAIALAAIPLIFSVIRYFASLTYKRTEPPAAAVKKWHFIFNGCAVATAIAWGAAAAYFVHNNAAGGAVAAGVVATIALAAAVLYAGAFSLTLTFCALALFPPTALSAMSGTTTGMLVSGGLVAAFAMATLCARIIKTITWDSVLAFSEIEQLTGHLDQRRTQVEKLNVALKTNADKREQAEITLRRTSADLGLVQGKAKALADTLERVSPMCQVTGLANRRHFDQQLESEWRRATREQKPVSLLMVEMDEFEAYLENYGRQSADTLLKKIAQSIKGFGRRSGDIAGRFEEEKLALLLPGCDARNATRMAEALRKRIEGGKIAHAAAKNRDIMTIHIGVATIKPARTLPNSELVSRSDAALYEARFQGGNKVVSYKPLSRLKIEKWDQPNDGPLSEQSMTQKLLVWGYDTSKEMIQPGDQPREHASEHDTVIAILTGELLIDVEGHTMVVKPGDTLFVPHGVTLMIQAASEKPVIKYTATKSS